MELKMDDRRRRGEFIPSILAFGLTLVLLGCSNGPADSIQPSVVSSQAETTRAQPTAVSNQTTQPATNTPVPISSPTPTLTSSVVPTNTATPLPAPTTPCTPYVCAYPGHFFMALPIASPYVDVVDPTYRYGSTQGGLRKIHHGVEFVNSQGTPVLAAADGIVMVAGNDFETPYADFPAFYGNLVVIGHQFPGIDELVFSIYGHLFEVQTEVGQQVSTGDQIGLVGFTGAAIGEHLHFEVRLSENSYRTTRNPELWLQPHSDESGQPHGAIAGIILDQFGDPIPLVSITIEQMSPEGDTPSAAYYLESYADWTVNGDDDLGENFALGDVPAGRYRVSFVARGLQRYEIEVFAGQVTMIRFDARELEN
jgi:murein DD-endopeptidase MepM/ murein hydrolase activator NlpD